MERIDRTLLDVANDVLADLDLEAVLARVLASARDLTGAQYAAMGILDEDGTGLAQFVTTGIDEGTRESIGHLPTGRGVLGELITNATPLRLSDVGSHPRSYGFPSGHPPMRSFLGVPVTVAGRPWGNLYLTEKAGGADFDEDDEAAVITLATFAGLAIDHARRYTAAEHQRDELRRTVQALEATVQIARAIGTQTDRDAVLQLIAKRGRALVSARALVVELLRSSDLLIAAAAGEVPADMVGRQLSLEDTVASAALRTKQTQRLEEGINRARFDQHGLGRHGVAAECGLVVPLMFRAKAYGVLVAVDREGDDGGFSHDDQRLLEAFAASAATAVATAETVEAEQRAGRLAAAEEERGRWARELHDETLQALAALRVELAAARRVGTLPAFQDSVGRALEQIDLEITNLRGLITDLRPAALDALGLEAALGALMDRVRAQGMEIESSLRLGSENGDSQERLVPELEVAAYRIVQEALRNGLKHAAANRAIVDVRESGAILVVTVEDDGAGFDPGSPSGGFGLMGMRERTEILGGQLNVRSAPGEGTRIEARLPLRRRTSAGPALRAAPHA